MRLAFISDIHGNALALDAVLKDIQNKNVDKIIVLGDICFRGPEPQVSLDLVRSLNTEVIKGNADEWVVRGIREGEVPSQALGLMTKEREWCLTKLEEESINYLRTLPTGLNLEFENMKIHAFHATPKSLFEVVQPSEGDKVLTEKLLTSEADIYIYAHIHKPYIRYINGKCLINTGSVGMPFDGLNMSSYLIIDIEKSNFQSSIVRVGYDVEKVINQLKDSDYPNSDLIMNILYKASI